MADLVAQRLLDIMPPEELSTPVVPPTDVANAAFQQHELSIAAREAALLAQMTEMMSLMRTGGAPTNNQQSRPLCRTHQ
ncbi:MAG: hypothetical protein ACOVOD_08705 [Rhodoferax sp.]